MYLSLGLGQTHLEEPIGVLCWMAQIEKNGLSLQGLGFQLNFNKLLQNRF
jgi:hypothetical protein